MAEWDGVMHLPCVCRIRGYGVAPELPRLSDMFVMGLGETLR